MSTPKISRRTFLHAGGAAIALPFLEIMLPFGKTAWAAGQAPLRFACLFYPHGTTQDSDWFPTFVNNQLIMNASGMLSPLDPYVADISFYKNLMADNWSLHPGGVTTFMTAGFTPQQNVVNTCRTTDQLIADKLQATGLIHSIAMGSDELSGGEASISGIYGTNISWIGKETPNTRLIRNSQIFDLIVPGGSSTTTTTTTTSSKTKSRQSVIDFAKDSITRLNGKLGSQDKKTFDQYLTNLREVEQKIQATEPPVTPPGNLTLNPAMATCSSLASKGSCADYSLDMDIKMDMIALAFQADRTRVMTHMFDPEPGYRNMSFISGVQGLAHEISHWRNDPAKLGPMVQKINKFYASKFARLLGRLKSMSESGGTVLDNSIIMYGSSMMDSHNHDVTNLPLILAGRAGGNLQQGALRTFPTRTNMSHFHLSVAKKFGAAVTSYSGTSSTINIG
ncbi:hypothetical protein AZI86_03140 [Bdellovibrio bacteriovorus]|uniref:DUF1552 domain-containing protein n=1 Tax=Bdellovibrio bacteriovorus TaxID=959 RepID=A0A150WNY5_BDEBC|nr:DUF1552 domain-containing protein [Bdellovibrio bacteriovorus]KYG66076.1 hypothetical protein AZI86_03140 [Bdellovibrio bacteriovorus]